MFLADFSGKVATSKGSITVTRTTLSHLQAHYPERLGVGAVVRMPWIGSLAVSLMWPFIDPETRKKTHINPDLSKELIAPEQLLSLYGGHIEWEWKMGEFMPALVETCLERRQANMARWKALGAAVGLSEWDFLEPFESTRPIEAGAVLQDTPSASAISGVP